MVKNMSKGISCILAEKLIYDASFLYCPPMRFPIMTTAIWYVK